MVGVLLTTCLFEYDGAQRQGTVDMQWQKQRSEQRNPQCSEHCSTEVHQLYPNYMFEMLLLAVEKEEY